MKYLVRNKIYLKEEPAKDAKKIYIICEGQKREVEYFQYFEGFSSNIDLISIPCENSQSDPVKLKEYAERLFFGNEYESPTYLLSEEYKDEVWFVIDTDRWNEGDKINILKEYCINCNLKVSDYIQWFVVQSNPCFEIWFYYHFYNEKPREDVVADYLSFKHFVHEAVPGGFNSKRMPIKIEDAIFNSKQNFDTLGDQPILFSTNVHDLGDLIVSFVKEQLDKAKRMLYGF